MKKVHILFAVCTLLSVNAFGFQMRSQREFGSGEAKNQNVVVSCTTPDGKISSQSCTLRRYAKCKKDEKKGDVKCIGWQQWSDLRNPGESFSDWRGAAAACCSAKGMR